MTGARSDPHPALRLVFAGTPAFAAEHLATLHDSDHHILAVYTQPDRAAGRGKKLQHSPVKALALTYGLPVRQPLSLRDPAEQEALAALGADLMVVVAYGLILPQRVLDTPRLGCINVHASLLPRWRGAAPIERAIEAGDQETGITIMQMDAGLDTGAMLNTARCAIDASTTGDLLRSRLAALGRGALLDALGSLASGTAVSTPQDDSAATYARKLDKAEAWIDWRDDAVAIDRKVRALCSANVAQTCIGDQRVKIWLARPVDQEHDAAAGTILRAHRNGIDIACGRGILAIRQLQLPGRKVLDVAAVLNARRDLFEPGTRCHQDA